MSDNEEKDVQLINVITSNIWQALATIASAAICAYWAHLTGGASGIGWFMFSLFLIW